MKKIFSLMLAFVAAASMTVFTSCGDDNENESIPAPEPVTAVKGSVTFIPVQASDFSEFYNSVTTIDIEDANGTFHFTPETNGTKNVVYEFECPATVKIHTNYPQAKKEVMDNDKVYDCIIGPGYIVAADGRKSEPNGISISGTGAQIKDKIAELQSRVYEFSIDKKGVITQK